MTRPIVTTDPIRLRPDGSIDTAHYLNRGRAIRSRTAIGLFRRAK